jgi:hypothetical protein
MNSRHGFGNPVSIYLYVTRANTTKNDSAALVVDKWLYIDGGEIWAKWGGLNTIPSGVWST